MKRPLLVLGVLLVSTRLLAAQEARSAQRQEFWFGVGGGWGSTGLSCDACTNERFDGLIGNAAAGATLSPNVLLGVDVNGWFHSEDGLQEQMIFLSAVGVFYPEVESGFFLKGGLGIMWYGGDLGADELTATAAAFSIGAGYEFRIGGGGWRLVPFLTSFATSNASIKLNGQSADGADIRFSLFQVGAGIFLP